MDHGRVLREARQWAGLSQRAAAARAGVSVRTVTGIETGEHRPSLPVLEALLAACGLELAPVASLPPAVPCEHLRAHLALSLTQRLSAAAGSTGCAELVLDALRIAAADGVAVLEPLAAAAVWVPGTTWPLPIVATVFPDGYGSRRRSPRRPARDVLVLRRSPTPAPRGLVQARLPDSVLDLHVHHPAALARDQGCRGLHRPLAAASSLLDGERGTDAAGRRAPAHRQPDEDGEAWRLTHALRYVGAVGAKRPSALDSRAFRLGSPVSLPQWLEQNGQPPLRGQRERW